MFLIKNIASKQINISGFIRFLFWIILISSSDQLRAQCGLVQYTVQGGGTLCNGTRSAGIMLIPNTQSGIVYDLYVNGGNSGYPSQTGIGGPLTWNVTTDGTFTVVAKSGSCTQVMSGSAAVTYESNLNSTTIVQSGSGCSISLTSSTNCSSYAWRLNSPTGTVLGTEKSYNATTNGLYYLTASDICGNWTTVNKDLNSIPNSMEISSNQSPSGACRSKLVLNGVSGSNYQWIKPSGALVNGAFITPDEEGTYTLKGLNSCGLQQTITRPVSFRPDISSIPVMPAKKIKYNTSVTLTAAGASTNEDYYWYKGDGSAQLGVNTYTTPNLTENTTYLVSIYSTNQSKCEGPKVPVNVNINNAPIVNLGPDQSMDLPKDETTIDPIITDPDDTEFTYTWSQLSGPAYELPIGRFPALKLNLKNLVFGTYVFRLSVSDGIDTSSDDIKISVNYSTNPGYLRETIVLVPGRTTVESIASLTDDEKNVGITYFDGLSRPLQSISIKASPDKKDIVDHQMYDEYGRESKAYLPYVPESSNGAYIPKPLGTSSNYTGSPQYQFYQTASKVAHDLQPYTAANYENSPIIRVTEQGAVGASWQPGTTRTNRVNYQFNVADEVQIWAYVPAADGTFGSIRFVGNYAANLLYKTTTTDANQVQVTEFTNKDGQVILRKAVNGSQNLYSYYVYDDFKQLRTIIPPQGYTELPAIPAVNYALTTSFLDKWCYTYHYDAMHRAIEKKTPGAGKERIVYDSRNRVVLTQDAVQAGINEWLYTKYDILDRPILSGKYVDSRALTEIQAAIDGQAKWYEEVSTGGHGYTQSNCYPLNAVNSEVLTVTYYDNYDHLGQAYWSTDNQNYSFIADELVSAADRCAYTTGLITGVKIKIQRKNEWLNAVSYYDNKKRAIQSVSKNFSGGLDRASSRYDFVGKILETRQSHTGLEEVIVKKSFEYDHAGRMLRAYHQVGADASKKTLLAEFRYNSLGQLIEKNIGGKLAENYTGLVKRGGKLVSAQYDNYDAYVADQEIELLPGFEFVSTPAKSFVAAVNNTTYLQSIDYRYNIRGWLTSINNSKLSNDNDLNDDAGDLFGMELLYEKPLDIAVPANASAPASPKSFAYTPNFNGNISAVKWNSKYGTVPAQEKTYAFQYDQLSRLTDAYYSEKNTSSGAWENAGNYNEESINYDLNGNIKGLKRFESTTTIKNRLMDNLDYKYEGNKLGAVNDLTAATGQPGGFEDKGSIGDLANPEYLYDLNGNLIEDKNKKVQITYNYLNLPERIDFGSNNYILYTYDALGGQLATEVYQSNVLTKKTIYNGDLVFENNKLDFILTAEGRVNKDNDLYKYEYFITDQLGNVRLSLDEYQGVARAIQKNDYYPFGMTMGVSYDNSSANRYLYNGKELQSDLGLNMYNFGARMYDPTLGRWHVADPAGQDFSPYGYNGNDPINRIDPDGRVWHIVAGAVIGGVFNVATNWDNIKGTTFWEKFGHGASFFAVGAVAGGVGAATGGAALAYAGGGTALAAVGGGGFMAGAGAGMVGGMSSGAFLGYGNAILGGRTVKKAVDAAVQGAIINGISGGVMGGMGQGINSLIHGGKFWTGPLGTGELLPGTATFPNGRVITQEGAISEGGLGLGVRENLADFAASKGLSTWKDWGLKSMHEFDLKFYEKAMEATSIHFNLTLKNGKMLDIINALRSSSTTFKNVTNWELQQIYNNPVLLKKTVFYFNGKVVNVL